MSKNLIYVMIPLVLTGCIGSILSGNTGYLCEEYPDIRSVPERPKATEQRCTHEGNEKVERASEFQKLEQDREAIKARDQMLREK